MRGVTQKATSSKSKSMKFVVFHPHMFLAGYVKEQEKSQGAEREKGRNPVSFFIKMSSFSPRACGHQNLCVCVFEWRQQQQRHHARLYQWLGIRLRKECLREVKIETQISTKSRDFSLSPTLLRSVLLSEISLCRKRGRLRNRFLASLFPVHTRSWHNSFPEDSPLSLYRVGRKGMIRISRGYQIPYPKLDGNVAFFFLGGVHTFVAPCLKPSKWLCLAASGPSPTDRPISPFPFFLFSPSMDYRERETVSSLVMLMRLTRSETDCKSYELFSLYQTKEAKNILEKIKGEGGIFKILKISPRGENIEALQIFIFVHVRARV